MSINEAATIQTTSINAVTPTTGTLSVGNTQTDGILNLGTGVRTATGVMNIATGASTACAINVMNGNTTAGSVNIANGTGASQTTAVNIGSGSTTGAVTIGNTGNATTLASGTTNIATSVGLTSSINILNGGGATTGGSVNIANGTSQTTTVNIASGTGTGTVTIGNTGNTTTLGSGIINVNGNLTMGTGKNITLGTVTNDSTVLNTITNATTNQTVTLSRVGQSYFLYRSTNSGSIPNITNTVLHSTTVTNAGIYTVCYLARYGATSTATRGQGLQAWLYVSSPAIYGGAGGYGAGFGQLALNLVGYASPYLELNAVGVAMTGSWTGLINANASVQLQCYLQYSTGSDGFLFGGTSNNYLSITRIA